METFEKLIPLQDAQFTQQLEIDDNQWRLVNSKGEELGNKFPGEYSPKQVMSYLHFARSYELEAFNIGIEFGKNAIKDEMEILKERAEYHIQYLEQQNIRLSEQLERMIILGSDEEK